MVKPLILAVDQSTSGTKAILFTPSGDIRGRADAGHEQKIAANGWVSHDPMEIYRNTIAAVRNVIRDSGVNAGDILGAGISNQRETALVWDRMTGLPVNDAVVWQCNRGEEICGRLKDQGDKIRSSTGLPLSPYFSAAKIAWILENTHINTGAELRAGTIDSWLIFKLTGNHKTDWSNASRTQLLDITKLAWDRDICALFGINVKLLPEICDSNSCFGYTDFEGVLPAKIPIHAALGDSHASLFGHGCLKKSMGKASYGTGTSVMINIGDKGIFCKNVVTSLAWGMNGKMTYVLEGNINYSGAVIKWLVDDIGLISSAREAGPTASLANPLDTTYLVPAFTGLGSPHWESGAKASLCGMTRKTGRAEIVKAAEECMAYQIADVIEAIKQEASIYLTELRVDGGGARDSFLVQFQSDILNLPLSVPENGELSAAGAACAAGIALGLCDDSVLTKMKRKRYEPRMESRMREERYRGWKAAVRSVIDFVRL
jgi:glycerol kinase